MKYILVLSIVLCSTGTSLALQVHRSPSMHDQSGTIQPARAEILTAHTESGNILAILPRTARLAPDWYEALSAAARKEMTEFRDESEKTIARLSEAYPAPPPYWLELHYRESFVSERIISVHKITSFYHPGAAHGSHTSEGLNYDRIAEIEISIEALFTSFDENSPALAALRHYVISDLKRQKQERLKDAYNEEKETVQLGDVSLPLHTAVLVPSNKPPAAGGLSIYFEPYIVGPYAEGSYSVAVPQEVFREYLAPEWQDQFAGEPFILERVPGSAEDTRDLFILLITPATQGNRVSSPVLFEGEAPDFFFLAGTAHLKAETLDGEMLATGTVNVREDRLPGGTAAGMAPFSGEIVLPAGVSGRVRIIIGRNRSSRIEEDPVFEVDFVVNVE